MLTAMLSRGPDDWNGKLPERKATRRPCKFLRGREVDLQQIGGRGGRLIPSRSGPYAISAQEGDVWSHLPECHYALSPFKEGELSPPDKYLLHPMPDRNPSHR